MTQTIEFNPDKYLPPEKVMQLPLIAKQRGFNSCDELLADLIQRDLFPVRAPRKTRKRRAAK